MIVDLNFEYRIFDNYTEEEIETRRLANAIIDLPFIPNTGDTFVWHEGYEPEINDASWDVVKNYSFEVESRVIYSSGYVVLNLIII